MLEALTNYAYENIPAFNAYGNQMAANYNAAHASPVVSKVAGYLDGNTATAGPTAFSAFRSSALGTMKDYAAGSPVASSVSSLLSSPGSSATIAGEYASADGATVQPYYEGAPLAQAYGMDAATAYQEALSNSSYQRAVRDLKAAGLNPVLAVRGLSGSDSFRPAMSSGGSGGSGSAKSWLQQNSGAIGAIVTGLVSLATGSRISGYAVGSAARGLANLR